MKNKLYKTSSMGAIFTFSFLIFICTLQSYSQNLSSDEDGVKVTNKGNLRITFDEFTGEIMILVTDTLRLSNFYEEDIEKQRSFVIPSFAGRESNLKEKYIEDKIFGLTVINFGYDTYLSDEMGNIPVLYLIDGERNSTKALYFRGKRRIQISKY